MNFHHLFTSVHICSLSARLGRFVAWAFPLGLVGLVGLAGLGPCCLVENAELGPEWPEWPECFGTFHTADMFPDVSRCFQMFPDVSTQWTFKSEAHLYANRCGDAESCHSAFLHIFLPSWTDSFSAGLCRLVGEMAGGRNCCAIVRLFLLEGQLFLNVQPHLSSIAYLSHMYAYVAFLCYAGFPTRWLS